jgi:hypothetical protein
MEWRLFKLEEALDTWKMSMTAMVALDNFSGYLLVDEIHVLSANDNQQRGYRKPPPHIDPCATPKEQLIMAAATAAAAGGGGGGGPQQNGGLISSFKKHHHQSQQPVVKVKEEHVKAKKLIINESKSRALNATKPMVVPPKQAGNKNQQKEKPIWSSSESDGTIDLSPALASNTAAKTKPPEESKDLLFSENSDNESPASSTPPAPTPPACTMTASAATTAAAADGQKKQKQEDKPKALVASSQMKKAKTEKSMLSNVAIDSDLSMVSSVTHASLKNKNDVMPAVTSAWSKSKVMAKDIIRPPMEDEKKTSDEDEEAAEKPSGRPPCGNAGGCPPNPPTRTHGALPLVEDEKKTADKDDAEASSKPTGCPTRRGGGRHN